MLNYILSSLADLIFSLITFFGYPGIIAIIAIENIFPPIPSELVLPLAGFLSTQGTFSVLGIILSSTLGSLLGAYVLYFFGYLSNGHKTKILFKKFGKYALLKEEDLYKSEEWFKKYGRVSVFFGRMVPLVRSLISIPAGYVKMPLWEFTIYTVVGSFFWNAVSTYAGVLLGENWKTFGRYIKDYEHLIVIALLLIIFYFVYKRKNLLISIFKR